MKILEEIYSKIDLSSLLCDLEPKDGGNYYVLKCPFCGEKEAYIYKGGHYIKCNRLNKCGYGVSIWDYAQRKGGLSNKETLEELAKFSDYKLPSLKTETLTKLDEERKKTILLEEFLSFCQKLIWQEEGMKTLIYLKERGYSEEKIMHMGLGHYPGKETMLEYLKKKGYREEDVIADNSPLRFLEHRENYRVIFAYRSPEGCVKAIYGRLTGPLGDGEKKQEKYKNFGKVTKDTFFGLHNVARGEKEIIVVEGFFDVMIAQAMGMRNVVSCMGSQITEAQLNDAQKRGIKRIILALDSDQAGSKGTENSLRKIMKAGLKGFVASLPEGKDPDSIIVSDGIDAFKDVIDKAKRAGEWMAEVLLEKNDPSTSLGRERLIEQAFDFDEKIPESNIREGEALLRAIAEATGEDIDALLEERESIRARRERERANKEAREVVDRASKLLRDGKTGEAINLISELLPAIKMKEERVAIEPYHWGIFEEEIKKIPLGLETGYKGLDEKIRIPQEAITLIAGRPSHGKTTFMMNLFLRMIERYPDKAFFFFSYEETRKQIMLKLLNIKSNRVIGEKGSNLSQLENYIRGENTSMKEIEEGKRKLGEYIESGRLWIIDKPFFVDELRLAIQKKMENLDIGAVFVDYIQRVRAKESFGTRQLEIQYVSNEILQIAKDFSLPIILGAQLGREKGCTTKVRLDNLREAGDLEQDAHLVLGLLNKQVGEIQEAKAKGEEKSEIVYEYDLDISILKQRDGIIGRDLPFKLYGPTNLIQEVNENTWSSR